jgi:glycine dehydrogenase subunit 1
MTSSLSHPYIPNSEPEVKEMTSKIGVKSVDELYKDVPRRYILTRRLNLPKALSECELKRHLSGLLSKNKTFQDLPIYLGAGCWPHYVPAVVENIVQRTELLTSYTPYQPEISQGMLQTLFEYQSMICELTNMDVANGSLYDWASSLGEAARLALRVTGRRELLVPRIIHPERLATLETYIGPVGAFARKVEYKRTTGELDLEDLKSKISETTAAVYVENPSYLGCIETAGAEIAETAHDVGALLVVGVDPISLGILKPPGDYGADVVVGEGQPLGNHMNFGGPLLGIFAVRGDMRLIRQVPGRIIGLTTTHDQNRRGFCMALQTREQHIRRQKATSNVCTNEALCAVASAVYLALLGPNGLKELCETIMYKSHYAMKRLAEIDGVTAPVFRAPHFKEFTVGFAKGTVERLHRRLLKLGVHGGKDISAEFPELGEAALYCVTETHSTADIDMLIDALGRAVKE